MVHGANTEQLTKLAREQGMRTLREAGLQRVIEGVTTVDARVARHFRVA